MSEAQPVVPAGDISDNDKLMAALCYFLPPIGSLIVLFVETMKVRPYQKYHAIQGLGLLVAELIYSVVACICISLLSFVGIGFCLTPLMFVPAIPAIYYAIIAYAKPAYFEIPVVTQFMKQQGWLTV